MPPRSCSIWRMTWRKLPLGSPTRLDPGTRTWSKATSQKWRLPVMSAMGEIVMPGACRSTINSERPAWGGAWGSVRAMR